MSELRLMTEAERLALTHPPVIDTAPCTMIAPRREPLIWCFLAPIFGFGWIILVIAFIKFIWFLV